MQVSFAGFLAIGIGAVVGAWSRVGLSVWLNHRHPHFPLGTFAANAIGGLLVGIALATFLKYPSIPDTWRLLIVTGFLGGLTTFSTYSAEVVALIEGGHFFWAVAVGSAHLVVSLALTAVGIWLVRTFAG